jgi:hypothetical protein
MDAITLLREDHHRFRTMLDEGEGTTERAKKTRRELLDRLDALMKAHEQYEEKFLYEPLREYQRTKDNVLEGYEEHHVCDVIVAELRRLDVSDERWGAKFAVLKENLEHHLQEEEEEMFKKARTLLDKSELVALGEKMQAMKRQLQEKAA